MDNLSHPSLHVFKLSHLLFFYMLQVFFVIRKLLVFVGGNISQKNTTRKNEYKHTIVGTLHTIKLLLLIKSERSQYKIEYRTILLEPCKKLIFPIQGISLLSTQN